VVGLEGVAFFGVHALDFNVEAQGVPWGARDGDFFGSEGFDIDEKGESSWKDKGANFFAFGEGLATDEEGGSEEVADGGDFDLFPLAGLGIGGNPFAEAGECAVFAFDACREAAGGIFFELLGMNRLEAISDGAGIERGVELVEGAGKTGRSTGAGENGVLSLVGNGGVGFCSLNLGPTEAVVSLEWANLWEWLDGKRGDGGLPSTCDREHEEKSGEESRHGSQGAEPNQPSGCGLMQWLICLTSV